MTISIEISNLDQRGYGIDGMLTRREWQQECFRKLSTDYQTFHAWQYDLLNKQADFAHAPPNFDWTVHYSDVSKEPLAMGWSGNGPSYFVFDISNFVINEDLLLKVQQYPFLHGAIFNGCIFNEVASFTNCTFSDWVCFIGAKFNNGASFSNSVFERLVVFDYSSFHGLAGFYETKFIAGASFKNARFNADAIFQNAQFASAYFDGSHFLNNADFSANLPINETKLKTFGSASFSGTQFEGRVNFSNREFTSSTRFDIFEGKPTRFKMAPLFHSCKLHQGTTFVDVIFPASSGKDSFAALAYNTLKLAMSQKQAIHEEQRFLKLELDAEKDKAKGSVQFLYCCYKHLSDYGFSAWRPFLWLVVLPFLCAIVCYGLFLTYVRCGSLFEQDCYFNTVTFIQTIEYSFRHALPPLGLDKASELTGQKLFEEVDPHLSFALTVAVNLQKVLSIAGWFFVALALRNRFKMK